MIPVPLSAPWAGVLLTSAEKAPSGGILDALPDPMKLDLVQVGFVIVLVSILFWLLNSTFFKPVLRIMDEREALIQAGATAAAGAASMADAHQATYDARLRSLREKAFAHRKALADAAAQQRQVLLEQAHAQAAAHRTEAIAQLESLRQAAQADLLGQVDALADAMARQLLKRVTP